MTKDEIRSKFRRAFGGPYTNFLTPDIERYEERGKFLCELSSGSGLSSDKLWGVTVIERNATRRDDLSKPFESAFDAANYMLSLQYLKERETLNET